MKKLVLFFVLISFVNLFSQTTSHSSNAILFPQGYGIKLLNSSGSSSIFNDVSNIGFMNPSSISGFENYSLGISYQVSSSIEEAWIADFGTSRVYNFYPQSFGGIVKLNAFTFGLGFGQKYNGTLETGPILITTTQNPDGTGEYLEIIQETSIHSYSLSAAYSLKDLFDTSNNLSVGFRFSLNRFQRYDEFGLETVKATDYSPNFAVGLSSDLLLDDVRKLFLGLSYETETSFEADIEFERNPILISDIDPNRPPNYVQVKPALVSQTPVELRFDFAIDATENLKFLTNLTAIFWKTETNNLKDQIEFAVSTVYKINEIFTPSIGFYYSDYKYENKYYSSLNSELSTFFITAGLRLNIQNYYADLAIADSHLFSGDYRKQTIGKLSVGVQL